MAGSIEWLAPLRAAAKERIAAGQGAWKLDPESWKYTRIAEFLPDAAPLEASSADEHLAFAGEPFSLAHPADFSTIDHEQQASVGQRLEAVAHPLADLNLSGLGQGLIVRGKPGESSQIEVKFKASDSDTECRRLLIHAPANSQLEVVECNATPARLHNLVIQVELDEGASLRHYRLSGGHGRSWTLIDAQIGKHACYKLSGLIFGPQRERVECRLHLVDEGAELETRHLLVGRDTERTDLQLNIRHGAPNARSRHLVKTLAADRSQLTVRGRVHIEPECPGSDAELTIRNLLLGGASRVNAKPELEIYTDDVSCAHGTTFAELDVEQLFYLLSRGIPQGNARALLLRAFAANCLFDKGEFCALNTAALNRIEALVA